MVRVGGPNEAVVADPEPIERRLPVGGPRIDDLVRIDPLRQPIALDVGRVLVHAGKEACLVTQEPVVARQRIGPDGLEHRVQRRLRAGVEDRGRQVEAVGHGRLPILADP